jgi:hypothetical protein
VRNQTQSRSTDRSALRRVESDATPTHSYFSCVSGRSSKGKRAPAWNVREADGELSYVVGYAW